MTCRTDSFSPDDLRAVFRSGGRLVADGAMGTMLIDQGLEPGKPPEVWNLERPDAVLALARGYVDAGADLIETNTFCGNRIRLREHGLEDRFEDINRAAVQSAREAAGARAFVLGSIGPALLRSMPPDSSAGRSERWAAYAEQAALLVSEGVSGLILETFMDLDECRCALEAARSVCNVPVMALITPQPEGRLQSGESPGEAARILTGEGAEAVGLNCGANPDTFRAAIPEMVTAAAPVVAMPSAGLPTPRDSRFVYDFSPEQLAALGHELWEAGAVVVGGCCGTTPNHIRALREELTAIVRA